MRGVARVAGAAGGETRRGCSAWRHRHEGRGVRIVRPRSCDGSTGSQASTGGRVRFRVSRSRIAPARGTRRPSRLARRSDSRGPRPAFTCLHPCGGKHGSVRPDRHRRGNGGAGDRHRQRRSRRACGARRARAPGCGECLWNGCVPSKALIAVARAAADGWAAGRLGVRSDDVEVDFGAAMAWVRDAQGRIAPHDSPERFRGLGVDVVEGEARFA